MRTITLTLLALVSTAVSALAQINVSLTPSGTSRFSDYFSNAYAQVNLSPQGMYDIDTNTLFGSANPFASGSWNIGSLNLDGTPTLSGSESFNVIGATGFDFNGFIDGNTASVLGAYSTSISGVSGSVSLLDGAITSLTFNSTVSFTFDAAPGLPYIGALSMDATSFDLLVDDDSVDFGFGPVRQVWDVDGATTANAVPEPSTGILITVGLGAFALCRRIRRRA